MGRDGYNGGSPMVREPLVDYSYIIPPAALLKPSSDFNFHIIKSGVNLENERGGVQVEFGYIIRAKSAEPDSRSKGIANVISRRRWNKAKQSNVWVAASALLENAASVAQEFHLSNPEAPRPFGLKIQDEAKEDPTNGSITVCMIKYSWNLSNELYGRNRKDNESLAGSTWQQRLYPEHKPPALPLSNDRSLAHFRGSPLSSRYDFSHFINSMDDSSFAYLSLIHEYASRPLQGNALQYGGLYRALVSQSAADEISSRISIIEFLAQGSRSRTFETYDAFKQYFDDDSDSTIMRRLIILEDLPVRLVCLLGAHLRIHPTIFARHYSTIDSCTISDDILSFPSILRDYTEDSLGYESDEEAEPEDKTRSFTLRYPITMIRVSAEQHPDPSLCPSWLKPSGRLTNQSAYPKFIVERCLTTPSRYSKWNARGETSELEGQVTYWSQVLPNGGWNSLLLVDPCLKDPSHLALINGATNPNLSRVIRYPELEDHYKVDLVPDPLHWHPSAAFTKYILHDDILIHYGVAEAGPGRTPLAVTPFIRGFAVSKWAVQLSHFRRCYSHMRAALFSGTTRRDSHQSDATIKLHQHTARWGAEWQEWIFESLTHFITDLSLYRLDVETNMRTLGIDIDDLRSHGFVGKREAQMWRYIRTSCTNLQELFQQLQDSYTQVIALREAQTSNVQAKSVRWLTILGTLFVPLSVVAGVMSMGGEFLPGEKRFWVYFAVVGPLLLFIGVILGVIMGWAKWKQILEIRRPAVGSKATEDRKVWTYEARKTTNV